MVVEKSFFSYFIWVVKLDKVFVSVFFRERCENRSSYVEYGFFGGKVRV